MQNAHAKQAADAILDRLQECSPSVGQITFNLPRLVHSHNHISKAWKNDEHQEIGGTMSSEFGRFQNDNWTLDRLQPQNMNFTSAT
mmetsp:Transcript_79229/g.164444  ORF Transcript_79229/g.164444 Transcript_79229/m.164444 type:complete len:86 (-) Transcript_79229:3197-3454(-)